MGALRSHGQRGNGGGARALAAAALAFLALVAATARAADPSSPAASSDSSATAPTKGAAARPLLPAPRLKEGTLVIFNRPIFTFRTSFIGNSPAQRAENARERISGLLTH